MSPSIEFWFDLSSNYSYLSAMRIEAEAARRGVAVSWVPFLLGPLFAAQGWTTSPFVLQKAKGAYVWRDMARRAARLGLPFQRPTEFPRAATLPMRVAAAHAGEPWLPAFCRALFTENFVHDRAIDAPELTHAVLRGIGIDPEAVLAHSESPEGRAALRGHTGEAQARGLFGAPTFFVGSEMYWGDDRLDDALDDASRAGDSMGRS